MHTKSFVVSINVNQMAERIYISPNRRLRVVHAEYVQKVRGQLRWNTSGNNMWAYISVEQTSGKLEKRVACVLSTVATEIPVLHSGFRDGIFRHLLTRDSVQPFNTKESKLRISPRNMNMSTQEG